MFDPSTATFKDANGRFLTQALFWEYRNDSYKPLFTLKPYDHEVDGVLYPSLKLIYMELADFPEDGEYDFAIAVFGPEGWTQWQKIVANKLLFKGIISEWRTELEVKRKAEAIKAIAQGARIPGKGFSAAKYLAEKGWEKRAGRPSKEEVERTKKIHAGIESETQEELDRLRDEGLLN